MKQQSRKPEKSSSLMLLPLSGWKIEDRSDDAIDDAVLPLQMEVGYVRVYELAGQ